MSATVERASTYTRHTLPGAAGRIRPNGTWPIPGDRPACNTDTVLLCHSGVSVTSPTTLRVSTLETALVDRLREEIVRGRLASGAQLRVRYLAARFGVSLTPVRSALARLEVEGYVTVSPRRGVEVTSLSAEDIQELVVMREALEAFAAEQALASITPETLDRMRRHLLDERAGLESGLVDMHRQFQLDHDFHMTLYEATGRPTLIEKLELLRGRSAAYMYTAAALLQQHEQHSLEMHAALLEAASRFDTDTVRQLTINHVRNLAATVIPIFSRREADAAALAEQETVGA